MVQETVFNLVYIANGTVELYGARLGSRGGDRRGGGLTVALFARQGKRKFAGRL